MNIARKLPSRYEVIPKFIEEVIDLLKKEFRITENEIFDIKLVLEESLTNAVKHGNKLDPDLIVDVSIATQGNQLIMNIKDQGKGFDPQDVPDPTAKDKLLRTSGRGVFLIKKLMDEVSYADAGREIKMIKILDKK